MFSKRIMIIDDDKSVCTVVKMTLKDKYDVVVSTSVLKALKYMSEYKIDLVLLDIKMPGINGIDALRKIKKRHPEITVIMLTAYASGENMQKADTNGAHGIIIKPFEVDELRSCVDTVLLEQDK